MDLKDWIMIAAVIAGPILAVQAQKSIEDLREKKKRKLRVFETLMATRATRVSQDHVSALNMIDLVFYGLRILGRRWQSAPDKAVTNAWKNYNDHLNDKSYGESRIDAWTLKGDDLFTSLLYAMSQSLGYDFDEVQLKRDCYRPVAHGNIEEDQHKIRTGVAEIIDGKRSLPIVVTYLPPYHPIDPVQLRELKRSDGANKEDATPVDAPS